MSYLTWERKQRIIEILEAQGVVQVAELAKLFDVSEITIRRDLKQLVENRNVERIHGGAVLAESDTPPVVNSQREDPLQEELNRIATEAVQLVQSGDTIMIGGGPATVEFARHLIGRRNLTVICTALDVATVLADAPGIDLLVIGGKLIPYHSMMVGHFSEHSLDQLHAEKCFLTAAAFDPEMGVTDNIHEAVAIVRAMVAASARSYLLLDHTKFGKKLLYSVIGSDEIDTIISDGETPPSLKDALQELGIEYIHA